MFELLSYLRDHKFKHNFQDIESAVRLWKDIKTTSYYLLYCHSLTNERSTLLNSIKETGSTDLTKSDSCITNILLFDNSCLLQKQILTSCMLQ